MVLFAADDSCGENGCYDMVWRWQASSRRCTIRSVGRVACDLARLTGCFDNGGAGGNRALLAVALFAADDDGCGR